MARDDEENKETRPMERLRGPLAKKSPTTTMPDKTAGALERGWEEILTSPSPTADRKPSRPSERPPAVRINPDSPILNLDELFETLQLSHPVPGMPGPRVVDQPLPDEDEEAGRATEQLLVVELSRPAAQNDPPERCPPATRQPPDAQPARTERSTAEPQESTLHGELPVRGEPDPLTEAAVSPALAEQGLQPVAPGPAPLPPVTPLLARLQDGLSTATTTRLIGLHAEVARLLPPDQAVPQPPPPRLITPPGTKPPVVIHHRGHPSQAVVEVSSMATGLLEPESPSGQVDDDTLELEVYRPGSDPGAKTVQLPALGPPPQVIIQHVPPGGSAEPVLVRPLNPPKVEEELLADWEDQPTALIEGRQPSGMIPPSPLPPQGSTTAAIVLHQPGTPGIQVPAPSAPPEVKRLAVRRLKRTGRLPTLFAPESTTASRYRLLAHRLEDLASLDHCRTIAITSPTTGDGKTTTALNLSIILAEDPNHRVGLIECDLREPTLASLLGLSRQGGLVGLCLQQLQLIDALVRIEDRELYLLPAGEPFSNPTEIIRSPMFSAVLHKMAEELHYLVIDTPAILSSADVNLLARFIDRYIVVVRAGHTRRDQLAEALRQLDETRVLGLVLNEGEV